MQKLIQSYALKACLTVLSLTLVSQTALADNGSIKLSYLDGISGSYLNKSKNYTYDGAGTIEASFKLDNKPVITTSKSKIKLSLRDSDIKQVLRMLADKAGVNIVFDKSVDGKITLDLNNVDVNDAFLIIFKAMQYTYILEDDTLTVLTLEAYRNLGFVRQNMTVLPIKYANADNVASFLNDNLFSSNIFGLSNKPIVTSNPATNQIVIFGSNADVMAIKRVLPAIDTKPTINNFKVSHTTPKEMANLICDSLFYNSGEAGSSKSQESNNLSGDEIKLGGGVIACRDGSSDSKSGGDSSLSSFKSNPLTVTYFSDLGKISVIGGSPEQIQTIGSFIKENDKKQLMAYVEMSIIELNENGSKTFNNTWNMWTPFISMGFNAGTFQVGGGPVGTFPGTNPMVVWGNKDTATGRVSSNNKAIQYTLKYVIDNGNGRVLTNPKFMVTNGRKTTIDMTSDYVKSVTEQVLTTTGQQGVTQKTYDIGSDNGLKIDIVPFISPDGYVSINITPETATIKDDSHPEYTLLQRRDLEIRNIRIKDGETLVLAGLIQEHESQSTKKMPVLSDLPFLGAFFRDNMNKKTREELVIVVTPHIIKDNDSQDSNIYDL